MHEHHGETRTGELFLMPSASSLATFQSYGVQRCGIVRPSEVPAMWQELCRWLKLPRLKITLKLLVAFTCQPGISIPLPVT